MTTSAPLQGLLGGVSLAIPVFVLLTNSGNVFGISGFMHRMLSTSPNTYAWWEGAAGVLGLVGGGAFVGLLQQGVLVQNAVTAPLLLPGGTLIRSGISGFLAGLGSKVGVRRLWLNYGSNRDFPQASKWVHKWTHGMRVLPLLCEVKATLKSPVFVRTANNEPVCAGPSWPPLYSSRPALSRIA